MHDDTVDSLKFMAAGMFGAWYSSHTSKYQEEVYKLIVLIQSIFEYKIPFDQMDRALCQNALNPYDVYCDISSGQKETDRMIALTEALGLPQHALIGRGVSVKGKIIDADKEPVRWLPEGTE